MSSSYVTDLLRDGSGHVLGDPLAEPLVDLRGERTNKKNMQKRNRQNLN